MEKTKILEINGLTKEYQMGEVVVHALRGVNFDIFEGEFVVVLGPSGSGKSTILNIIGGIDTATGGEILYRGKPLADQNDKQLTQYRRKAVGFVFQFYNLIPNLTAIENISMSATLSDDPIPARTLLEQIELGDRADHFPSQLSGGQQQRIAVARAVAKNPDLLLCDEPTGALDVATGIGVLRLLADFNRQYKKTVVIITHNAGMAAMGNRVIHIKDGLIDRIDHNKKPVSPEEVVW